MEHEKRTEQLRKLELKRADYVKIEKTKKEVEKLESRIMVASQGIETTTVEINKLRESELYPQLVDLVKGLVLSLSLSHARTRTHIFGHLQALRDKRVGG